MDKLIDKDLQELGHRLTEQELQQLGQQYLGISDFQQREARYASVIYPQLRDHYKTLPAADPPIEVLLVPVSGPHLPVLVAARWKPKRIYTIYSTLSIKYKPFIDQEIADLGLGISLSGDKPVKNIEFEPDRLYRAVKEALQPYVRPGHVNHQIAVDITGGTSVMSVGAAMAVSFVGGRFFYVLSGTAKDDVHQAQKGTSEPRPLTDPYAVYGDWEADEACHRFAAHDYAGAEQIFVRLTNHVPEPEKTDYQAYATLAHAYAAWDSFDLGSAEAALQQLANGLPTNLVAWQQILVQQKTGLARLTEKASDSNNPQEVELQIAGDLNALGSVDLVLPLLGSLYTNGLRRVAVEVAAASKRAARYDMAAMLLYRCLELMSQHRLAKAGISTLAPDYAKAAGIRKIDLTTLRSDYAKVAQAQTTARQRRGWTQPVSAGLPGARFGLFAGYMLLAALGDDLVREYPIERIEERTEARNNSILAHGYRLITREDYLQFRAVVDALLDRFFKAIDQDQAAWEATYRFINPFETAGG